MRRGAATCTSSRHRHLHKFAAQLVPWPWANAAVSRECWGRGRRREGLPRDWAARRHHSIWECQSSGSPGHCGTAAPRAASNHSRELP